MGQAVLSMLCCVNDIQEEVELLDQIMSAVTVLLTKYGDDTRTCDVAWSTWCCLQDDIMRRSSC